MAKKKKIEQTEMKPIHRDMTPKSNRTLAKMIINGEIDENNWQYIVRKMGYKTKPVEILLGEYRKWK